MEVFGAYSKYYDLLYKNKDYKSEVDFVHSLIRKYAPDAKTILDLGCGTGKHDLYLSQKGYNITGIDISEEMISIARSTLPSPKSEFEPPTFLKGDIRNIRLDKRFDIVISLFHVMSYQTTNDDLKAALETASIHLNSGGVFIFDFWYGPAVLSELPSVRIKRMENEEIKVTRIAEPIIQENENIVTVNYELILEDKKTNKRKTIKENHIMRYLFLPELELMLKDIGFNIVISLEWMDDSRGLSFESWNGLLISRKNG